MDPTSVVYDYGYIKHFVSSMYDNGSFHMMQNYPDYQPVTHYQLQRAANFIDGSTTETDGEVIVTANIYRVQNETWVSPIVLDLNNDGFNIVNLDQSIAAFDYGNNGKLVRSAWLTGDDGFLTFDRNGDGSILDLSEMFGGREIGVGFDQLRLLDSDSNNMLDSRDELFGHLRA